MAVDKQRASWKSHLSGTRLEPGHSVSPDKEAPHTEDRTVRSNPTLPDMEELMKNGRFRQNASGLEDNIRRVTRRNRRSGKEEVEETQRDCSEPTRSVSECKDCEAKDLPRPKNSVKAAGFFDNAVRHNGFLYPSLSSGTRSTNLVARS